MRDAEGDLAVEHDHVVDQLGPASGAHLGGGEVKEPDGLVMAALLCRPAGVEIGGRIRGDMASPLVGGRQPLC